MRLTSLHGNPTGAWGVSGGLHVEHPGRSDVRRQAIARMRRMSVLHARHAWEQRYKDPIAPHALALLFQQFRGRVGDVSRANPALDRDPTWCDRYQVTAAWRLWLDGPEASDLPRMLFDLHHEIAPRVVEPGYDPRADLATGRDRDMLPDALYTGLAVTSLGAPDAPWEALRHNAESMADVPSVIRIVLADSTVIVCHRHGRRDMNTFRVWSTHDLDFTPGNSPYAWSATTMERLRPDAEDHRDPLRWLIELSDTFMQADNRRVVAGHSRRSK